MATKNIPSYKYSLSICIATYNRGLYLASTLDSLAPQITKSVELIVVDGNSTDNTSEIIKKYKNSLKNFRYFQEPTNSGVDIDYDRAVMYAQGEFCWLMTDDDLVKQCAVETILNKINKKRDLIILNSEVKDKELRKILESRRLNLEEDTQFNSASFGEFFSKFSNYMSFIGCIVIRRSLWLSRNRSIFYGSLFIHIGVIFQNTYINEIYIISQPLLTIRYGNAMWTPRTFEIWIFKWPQLIWSFKHFSDEVKLSVVPKNPMKNLKLLFYHRALGGYNYAEYKKINKQSLSKFNSLAAFILSIFPGRIAALISVLFFMILKKSHSESKLKVYDILNCSNGKFLTNFLTNEK
ncbi:MAG: glycosyltransferase [Bdellovibrionales bacterium]|nr:glycosyltransferase [Bdellovibrionales bacterium]